MGWGRKYKIYGDHHVGEYLFLALICTETEGRAGTLDPFLVGGLL